MGYYAHSEQSDICILRKNFPKALKALQAGNPDYKEKDHLPEVIAEFGLTVRADEHGNICEIYYEYQKFYSDEMKALFKTLAPFVEPGSYIAFRGEDSSSWAYYFDGSCMKKYHGETIYPGMPMNGPSRAGQRCCEFD